MVRLAIALMLTSPIAFLLVGFLGVSRQRAEESKEYLELSDSLPATSVDLEIQPEPSQRSVQPFPPALESPPERLPG